MERQAKRSGQLHQETVNGETELTSVHTQSSFWSPEVSSEFKPDATAVIMPGDALVSLKTLPDGLAKLIITSPPYNLGKAYEKATELEHYLESLSPVLDELIRLLAPDGSLCWQVGNYVDEGEVYPLDVYYYPLFKHRGLKLRNRIVWHFEHGLHASKRFSGRYETLLWFTKSDEYIFNLDSVRVPSKYPGKTHFKPGEKYGKPSGNPLGKNPSDKWKIVVQDWGSELWDIPNVKANHPEKTLHPCQFPIELVERCVLALTNEGDWVLDPFSGVGSALLAALKHNRRAIGCEKESEYIQLAHQRIADLYSGRLRYRELGKPVHQPTGREKVARIPDEWLNKEQDA
jgi:DNA modification methylase